MRTHVAATHVAAGVLLCLACSDLTDVRAPDVVQPPALNNPAGAEALRAGVLGLFTGAFAGSGAVGALFGQVVSSGAMADELFSATTSADTREIDSRTVREPTATSFYPYQDLQRTHVNALLAIAALKQYAPTPRSNTGQMFAILGFTKVLLAENQCSGVPISPIVDGQPAFGEPLTTDELFAGAVFDFDSALVYAADSARILNLARVGRARALLGRGRFADAANAATAVPTDYAYVTEQSGTVQRNIVFERLNTNRSFTVADREGQNGLDFRAANDPRVPTRLVGPGNDGTNVFTFTLYSSAASPIVLASGVEARLIEAEAALQGGNAVQLLSSLNAPRANAAVRARYGITSPAALPPLVLPATRREQEDLLFRERAFWLFLTGHRLGDLRRLARPMSEGGYGRPVESVFPTGAYKVGQTYGAEVTFAPDQREQLNPNFAGCLDRDP